MCVRWITDRNTASLEDAQQLTTAHGCIELEGRPTRGYSLLADECADGLLAEEKRFAKIFANRHPRLLAEQTAGRAYRPCQQEHTNPRALRGRLVVASTAS